MGHRGSPGPVAYPLQAGSQSRPARRPAPPPAGVEPALRVRNPNQAHPYPGQPGGLHMSEEIKYFVIQGNDFPSKIVRGTEAQVKALVDKLDGDEIERVKAIGGMYNRCRIYWRYYEFLVEDLA